MKTRSALLVLALAGFLPAAHAQTGKWPDKPVRVVVPFAPGGATDVVARIVSPRLSINGATLELNLNSENVPHDARCCGCCCFSDDIGLRRERAGDHVIIVGVGADRALDNQRGQARIKFEF